MDHERIQLKNRLESLLPPLLFYLLFTSKNNAVMWQEIFQHMTKTGGNCHHHFKNWW